MKQYSHLPVRLLVASLTATAWVTPLHAVDVPEKKVSYYHDVRPIFQANCQGCHQPSKLKGGYAMTDFKKMLAGGEKEGVAITPGHPDKSAVIQMITPENGAAEMPKGKSPLNDIEIDLVKKWIAQGAEDDTPADARVVYDPEHPPVYTQAPVVSAMDYSPDGKYIAVAGFHEVLLHKADGSGIEARLIGLSERVQSVAFSPDGKWLAVGGGNPARMGEIQVWDVEKRKLTISAPITYDTIYGVSWSPDSKLIAFGCSDNTVRTIEAATGKQILQMGSHTDWALSTAFSLKGDHIISGGRDMTVKLTEVSSARFIDNVTSITPGALKGGILSIATHPKMEHIVVAGSDGLPKVYRIFREAARKIGDDAALIADLFPMTGRVFSTRFSADGKKIACGSSFDGKGEILVTSYDYDGDVPDTLRKIMGIVPTVRKSDQKKALEDYKKQGIHELARVEVPAGVYAVAFSPDGNTVAAAGSDGKVRLIDIASGKIASDFSAAQVTPDAAVAKPAWAVVAPRASEPLTSESLPEGAKIVGLEIQPAVIKFGSRNDAIQTIVMARIERGGPETPGAPPETVDVTRMVHFDVTGGLAEVSQRGNIRPLKDGAGQLTVSMNGQTANVPVGITGFGSPYRDDFVQDVAPVLAKLGCNAGTCHGAKEGKSGFKLSLRGYDPEYDVRALTDDLASRRVNIASPDNSLMLLKAVAEVPHEGGRRTTVDEKYYQIIRQWIAGGAKLNMDSKRVAKIELFPKNPVVQQVLAKQQMRIVATFGDGAQRDVTAEAFIESGNQDVAVSDAGGLVATLRRGEAPVLARYEGNYAATTVTVMGDRSGFTWQEQPAWNKIDELVAAKWQRMKILPSELCEDNEFIRRVYLDLIGLPPTTEDVRTFVADTRDTKTKREELVDKLIGSPDYVDHWTLKWADLLQCNAKFLGKEGAESFRQWIHTEVENNTPYDKLVSKILTASGSNKENPAASYWKILRTPQEAMENTTQLFLATRFNCNKCHDHPFERWTQDQYYHTAAYFAQVKLETDPASGDKKIGGSAVEGAKPLYEIVKDMPTGEINHDRTGKVSPPEFPYPAKFEENAKAPRREELAEWITSPDNRFFASSYVNRLWGYMFGIGIIDPLDDIRAGNPPTNPELLDHLTKEFIRSGFNTRHVMQLICKSHTYNLSVRSNKWNEDDKTNYSHALARRLPAETLFDAVFRVTGSIPKIPGAKPGMRAAQLPDSGIDVASGLLANLGRPPRESACECERSTDFRLGSIMALLSGPTISEAINNPDNDLAKLAASEADDRKLINEVFLRILSRDATEPEINKALELFTVMDGDQQKLMTELGPKEKEFAPIIAKQEKDRLAAIAMAKKNLNGYEEATKFYREEGDKLRKERLEANTKLLADYEKELPEKAAALVATAKPGPLWTVLKPIPKGAKSSGFLMKLTAQKDNSILSEAGNSESEYDVTMETSLKGITGVLLEVLPHDSLPNFGPGRSKQGTFRLSEFQMRYASKTNPEADQPLKLVAAKADVEHEENRVAGAIDGESEKGKGGWGLPKGLPPSRHWAAFKFEKPIGEEIGTVLKFTLIQNYDSQSTIGRFRLWVTTSPDPLDAGMPDTIAKIAKIPEAKRKPEQNTAVVDYFRDSDPWLWKLKAAINANQKALPVDPKYTGLKDSLAKASEPVKLDPQFVQLRTDAAASLKQVSNKRLTTVQDLAWALINNAAFLFNR